MNLKISPVPPVSLKRDVAAHRANFARAKSGLNYSILLCLLCITGSGCTTEYNLATKQEETLMFGTEKEIRIGDAVSKQMDANYALVYDLDVNNRVQRILNDIVQVCDRQELIYIVKIIDKDLKNAVSLPGGYIYIFKGMLDMMDDDDQLAGVIAHEIGHITAKHGMKKLQAAYGYTLLQVLAVGSGEAAVARGVNAVFNTLFSAYSVQDEYEADRLAVKYTKQAGYDPKGMQNVLKKLQREQEKAPSRPISYFRTHPHISKRISALNKEITGKLEFKDYLNLTEDEGL